MFFFSVLFRMVSSLPLTPTPAAAVSKTNRLVKKIVLYIKNVFLFSDVQNGLFPSLPLTPTPTAAVSKINRLVKK